MQVAMIIDIAFDYQIHCVKRRGFMPGRPKTLRLGVELLWT